MIEYICVKHIYTIGGYLIISNQLKNHPTLNHKTL